ncbi:hypothetical protein E3P89_01599 [Wallemia ichthyophaga]|nr:hypothetical protein E3P94_01804 [Wallemia ichthyophaga]TIB23408.1 hypothetical protein E3P89_01599 [Wallemia ichthyophaga]
MLNVFYILLVIIYTANAYIINIPPRSKDCYFEDLHKNDEMTVTYQVSSGGNLDIDFALSDPNIPLYTNLGKDTGTYSFTADKDGRYSYCFSNSMSYNTDKVISFNVHGILYVPDEGHTLPIEQEIRILADNVKAVQDEHEYLKARERSHRDTAESTNSRVKWWSIAQSGLLIVTCAWQVYYLKAFFEVKRVI